MVEKLSTILKQDDSKPIEFIIPYTNALKEANEYIPTSVDGSIPRFALKGDKDIENIPINKPIKPTEQMIITAVKYGMIFLITYKGIKDNHTAGHERVIYPMVLGRSSVGKLLIRGYHLKGWSTSYSRDIQHIWRMFRFDRIKSITFTGSFYRLAPKGYNRYDKGMRGGILAAADINEIRTNQQKLVKAGEIQNKKEIELTPEPDQTISKIQVKQTDTKLDLMQPYENPYIESEKNAANLRLTLLKSIYGNTYFAVLGALGKPGNTVQIKDDKNKNLGTFKVLDSIGGDVLKRIKNIKGNKEFDLWIFDKKI